MVLNWKDIDTVLLDMDGTLLDRHFDDHFWLEHVPRRYADKHGIALKDAKAMLISRFRSQENTLNWTDLDYWTEQLGLDIPLLKEEVDHLIAVHPFVVEFLLYLRQQRKAIYLVTNAHSKTLTLKMRKTRIGSYFDGIISAHDLGLPKEDAAFWPALASRISYDPERTLLGEDSETNLSTAAQYGIKYLIYVSRFSSALTPKPSANFSSIHYFSQLIPKEGSTGVDLAKIKMLPPDFI
ncbi:HAD superfamily hydrolase [Geotalea daltonii FRC-32]|uniref:HAD superfamily hydrolase n=1 Tax=Geotalea daltonii (strain DSM 22248 / JCM 15807 / FRC-32) TaxID=316067 RepID=B9M1F0_GEODF|nr:GMP/IMP nucleotidase [Geotalea daltonii]ACM21032.1 HAD superfamily hydrolase [Geotalea daltonii FRC-32]